MSIALKIDTRELQKALQLYERATGKDSAEIINKAGFNITMNPRYGTVKNMPKADPKKIESRLMQDGMGLKIAARRLKGKRGKGWQKKVGREARREKNYRKRAAGYAASGEIKAGVAFGGRRRVAKKFSEGGQLGYGIPAKPRKLFAEVVNTTADITKVRGSFRARQRAVNGAAKDMAGYASQKLMQRTANKYSAK